MLKHPDSFVQRHLGPSESDRNEMLKTIGVSSLQELISQLFRPVSSWNNP